MMPVVSVVIPTYNRASLLGRAIQSVLGQTYQDFEIIIVDDGSSDNTEGVVQGFDDKRIRYIRYRKNRGEAAARNTGIKAANGRYIASQDSDDIWLPEKLEKQIRIFEKDLSENIGVVYTGFCRIKDGQEVYTPPPEIKQKEGDIHNSILEKNFIGTPTTVIKKKCFEKSGTFNEKLPHLVDWELWIRISKYYRFKYISEPLVRVHYTTNSISSDNKTFLTAMELILEKHHEDFKKNRKLLAKHLYAVGGALCHQGEMSRGRSYILEAAKAYPLNTKFGLAFFISLFGPNFYKEASGLKKLVIDWLK